jgi:copper chaperone NosL
MQGVRVFNQCRRQGVTRLLWAGAISVMLFAGCQQGSATPAPPEIRYGQDVCADCNMIISDPRFASGYAYEIDKGRFKSLAFDDMGDLVSNLKSNPDRKVAGYWAHDFESEEWIDATTAWYVVSSQIKSPMGHGVAAYATREAAQVKANALGAEVLDWNRMRAEVLMHNH